MCKWTRLFWGTDCQRTPKRLSSAQAASLCSTGIGRARKCLLCEHVVRCATVPTVGCFSEVFFRQEKRARRLTFWVRRRPDWVGVFHAKGWWPPLPRKFVFLGDVPGILQGCPGPLGVFKSLCKKSSCAFFVPYFWGSPWGGGSAAVCDPNPPRPFALWKDLGRG